ncbi:hypothetical protein [Streptomyces olivaceus]|uniref:hypothetical protein n=1 Tax=Streptomyces olivaceus TaxID=47716 RepID=UPI0033B0484B
MVKQGTDRWSLHPLRRMQARDPEIHTVSISPEDSSVTINGKSFDARGVAGHAMTRANVSVLLALRDVAREVPAMPVPQFLIVDGPFTGLGEGPENHRNGNALLDDLTDLATSEDPSGVGGQVIIACNELPGTGGTGDPYRPRRRCDPGPFPRARQPRCRWRCDFLDIALSAVPPWSGYHAVPPAEQVVRRNWRPSSWTTGRCTSSSSTSILHGMFRPKRMVPSTSQRKLLLPRVPPEGVRSIGNVRPSVAPAR